MIRLVNSDSRNSRILTNDGLINDAKYIVIESICVITSEIEDTLKIPIPFKSLLQHITNYHDE
jgi:hypothetical protein